MDAPFSSTFVLVGCPDVLICFCEITPRPFSRWGSNRTSIFRFPDGFRKIPVTPSTFGLLEADDPLLLKFVSGR